MRTVRTECKVRRYTICWRYAPMISKIYVRYHWMRGGVLKRRRLTGSVLAVLVVCAAVVSVYAADRRDSQAPKGANGCMEKGRMEPLFLGKPQWTTSSRLLKLREKIEFHFYLPRSAKAEELLIFPNYLERAEPGAAFV